MLSLRFLFIVSLTAASTVFGQGLPPEWETRQLAESLVTTTQQMLPLLEQVKPEDWVKNGASSGYVKQLEGIKKGAGYLGTSAKLFSQNPQKLPPALDTYLRAQWLEMQVGSLEQGVRKYQNQTLADQINAASVANSRNRGLLQQYLLDLAAYRETEMSVMSQEAQTCRAAVTRPTATRPTSVVKPKEPVKQ